MIPQHKLNGRKKEIEGKRGGEHQSKEKGTERGGEHESKEKRVERGLLAFLHNPKIFCFRRCNKC